MSIDKLLEDTESNYGHDSKRDIINNAFNNAWLDCNQVDLKDFRDKLADRILNHIEKGNL